MRFHVVSEGVSKRGYKIWSHLNDGRENFGLLELPSFRLYSRKYGRRFHSQSHTFWGNFVQHLLKNMSWYERGEAASMFVQKTCY